MKLTMRFLLPVFGVLLLANAAAAAASWTSDAATCAGTEGTVDERIVACTRAITSGQLSPEELAISYYNRGIEWRDKGDYDKAIADYSEAIRRNPQYALAYNNRGIAWRDKGDYDKAIADYSEAILLNPQYVLAYNNRGIAWRDKGDYDKAIADYSEAILLNPEYALAYNNRGIARFNKGEFSSAALDLAQSQQLKPSIYTAIWLYLARARNNSDGETELTLNTKDMDGKKWPAPVAALYLGKSDSTTVISQSVNPEQKKYKEQLCEANFFLGEWHLLHNETQQARMLFTKAQNECPKTFSEYGSAVTELQRIK
ncbi:MAG: tetratricopeptide repeat protein [Nitrospirae bacterium]|nr:tetratricopeptide repeat protein [Nitrospirota bacterium]